MREENFEEKKSEKDGEGALRKKNFEKPRKRGRQEPYKEQTVLKAIIVRS